MFIDFVTFIVLLSSMLQQSVSSTPVKSMSAHIRYTDYPLATSSSLAEPLLPRMYSKHNSVFDNPNDDDLTGLGGGGGQQHQKQAWINSDAEQVYLETSSHSDGNYLSNSNDFRQDEQQQKQPYLLLTKMPEYSNMLYGSYSSTRKVYSPVKHQKRSYNFNNNNNNENTDTSNNLSQNPFASLASNYSPHMGPRLSPSLKQMIDTNPFARAWLGLLLKKIVQEQPVPYIFKYGKK
ncbi:unnamed protein product [Didymodactylos carnosus]|uniref:Uncharacterized protein n=1 Tax=Didymodactylos carnosus TaxID=1234261 RepID=A0A814U728_9BILA|nr:unnamed protein product [Didymodactylos carnosus]CAF1169638.1 unnamed protein product [Didymodactylos carnosus]CAF3874853.1 unnamed protein product [Didymodactylos carnosus]CAF3933307.1 unnamed protein product [Didymodactylos carnosus]